MVDGKTSIWIRRGEINGDGRGEGIFIVMIMILTMRMIIIESKRKTLMEMKFWQQRDNGNYTGVRILLDWRK